MISRVQQTWAFFYRDWQLTRRYWSWVVVFTFYAIVTSATVALIGVAAHDPKLTLTLTVGALLWSFLSVLFNEIAMSIAFERWEGTLEYTFMAPVSRFIHLMGVSLYALSYSLLRTVCVLAGLSLIIDLHFQWLQLPGIALVLAVSSVAFVGMGLIAATLPVMSPERGAEATNILQGVLLLISGVYYPVNVLPKWLQPGPRLTGDVCAPGGSTTAGVGRSRSREPECGIAGLDPSGAAGSGLIAVWFVGVREGGALGEAERETEANGISVGAS